MAASIENLVSKTLDKFLNLIQKPEIFLSTQESHSKKFKSATKVIYDLSKSYEPKTDTVNTLQQLIIDNFDEEQVWQELELQNHYAVNKLLSQVAGVITKKEHILFSKSKEINNRNISQPSRDVRKKSKHLSDADESLVERGKINHSKGLKDENTAKNVDIELMDDNDSDADNTDNELEKIKSRLKTDSDEDHDNSDLDFDFDGFDKEFGNDEEKEESGEDNDVSDHHSDVRKQKTKLDTEDNDVENVEMKRFKDSLKKNRSIKKNEESGSIVDDKFFKLAQLESFLDQEDAREERRRKREAKIQKGSSIEEESSDDDDDDDDDDMFGDLPSDEYSDSENVKSTRNFTYEDFFDPPEDDDDDDKVNQKSKKDKDNNENFNGDDDDDYIMTMEGKDIHDVDLNTKRKKLLEDSDSEGEDVHEILGRKYEEKSSFEKRQEKLKKKIEEMEEVSLKEKSWQMSGEVTSSLRPENSLLEEHVMFDHTTRLPPVITEETTKTLEDIIKQRIKDKVWDDVERKVKTKEEPFEYKKRIVLDQEKSKQSLGEIYEQEYLKLQQKEEEEKEDPAHEEIKKMMQSLFLKLDALSNFHFTPKQATADVKIVTNLPSISIEEVAPVSVSDNKLLAPEEIQEKVDGELKGKTEKSSTDKKRERRKKKIEKRIKRKEKEKRQKLLEKMKPAFGNKKVKENAMKQMEKQSKTRRGGVTVIKDDKKTKSSLTSSKSFFMQLQEEVSTQIKSKKSLKRSKENSERASSKKLKL